MGLSRQSSRGGHFSPAPVHACTLSTIRISSAVSRYWGRVVLDVQGFRPDGQDVPAEASEQVNWETVKGPATSFREFR